MNSLRLVNINFHAPYRVMEDPEHPHKYYFVSDGGTKFEIDFTPNDSVLPSGSYEFSITNKSHDASPLDPKLRLTLFAIIEEFFDRNNEVMLYLAETGDGKQYFRNRLFVRWFNMYEQRDKYLIRTAEGMMDGQMNFLAIISRLDNPHLSNALEEFDETISFLFDEIDVLR